MKELKVRVVCEEHSSIEDVEKVVLKYHKGYKTVHSIETYPDILEDGTIIYVYYVNLEWEDE